MAFYNPYTVLSQVKPYDFQGNHEMITERFNQRIARETAARQAAASSQQNNPYLINQNQMGAISGALSAASQPHEGFKPGNHSALQGAAQGFASGGVYGALAGAIAAPISQVIKSHRNLDNLDTSVGSIERDQFGQPIYNSRAVADAAAKLPELNKTAKWDSTNILGLGGKAKRKRSKLRQGIADVQGDFNQQAVDFNSQQAAMNQYSRIMDNTNRMRNLYSIGTSLY